MASHAGTTPMDRRRDAATAAAELALYLEKRGAAVPDLVATMGMLRSAQRLDQRGARALPVQPGHPRHHQRGARRLHRRRARRSWRASASGAACTSSWKKPCAPRPRPATPAWMQRWERAVAALGLPLFHMPSGAGHDAMKLHEVMPQAMLFMRGLNAGISHNPLESITNTTPSCACAPSRTCSTTLPRNNHDAKPSPYQALDAWVDAHFDEQVHFLQELVRVPTDTPPGNNAPHAERTAELLQAFGFEAEKHPVPAQQVKDYGLQSITNLIVRRPYGARPDDRAERPRRRGAARRRLDARPLRRRGGRRQALRPRRGGEQVRLLHLHLRGARAGVAAARR